MSTSTNKRRSSVKRGQACQNCRRSHVACSVERPCKRCVKLGLEDSCSTQNSTRPTSKNNTNFSPEDMKVLKTLIHERQHKQRARSDQTTRQSSARHEAFQRHRGLSNSTMTNVQDTNNEVEQLKKQYNSLEQTLRELVNEFRAIRTAVGTQPKLGVGSSHSPCSNNMPGTISPSANSCSTTTSTSTMGDNGYDYSSACGVTLEPQSEPAAIAVWKISDRSLVQCNEAFCKLVGAPMETLLAQCSCPDLFPDRLAESVNKCFSEMVATGSCRRGYPTIMKTYNGEEVHCLVTARLQPDPTGQPLYYTMEVVKADVSCPDIQHIFAEVLGEDLSAFSSTPQLKPNNTVRATPSDEFCFASILQGNSSNSLL
mmetsp:Transcript_15450/g.23154  ORF Transcript_15450/g.23154 Transcript_15450/m.23154 type:complete len:370 (+) Transcript_15450:53-1162(+)